MTLEETIRTVAEIRTHPETPGDYSAYVPIRLGAVNTAAYVDSGNTFANVISPATMDALGIRPEQLEPVPQLSVGTAAAGKNMKILGQAPWVDLQIGGHPAKFRIRPLVLQGLVHPVNICGPFLARANIDQLHSKRALRIQGKEVPMCSAKQSLSLPPTISGASVCTLTIAAAPDKQPHLSTLSKIHMAKTSQAVALRPRHGQIITLDVRPLLQPGTKVLMRPNNVSRLGPQPIIQEVAGDGTIAVLLENH